MAWIETVAPDDAGEPLRRALSGQRALYPPEYADPVASLDEARPGIVEAHSLLPEVLFHQFATFGALMSPDLPLSRRDHEMIATVVSLTNECRY